MNIQSQDQLIWRSPEEIMEIAFQRATVVMMNEAHSGLTRCIRTRQIGQKILPVAHEAGVRHLAMEVLFPYLPSKATAPGVSCKETSAIFPNLICQSVFSFIVVKIPLEEP